MHRKRLVILISLASGLATSGCSKSDQPSNEPRAAAVTEGSEMSSEESQRSTSLGSTGEQRAEAKLQDAPNVSLAGTAEFKPVEEGVRAVLEVENATPGMHGVHVHQNGDCSDIPGKSMGAHLAPTENQHGLPDQSVHHLGDMGNINVGSDGKGRLEIVVKGATLDNSQNTLLGKALVVHEKEDIGVGPSGESGTPIACGVIEKE